MPLLIALISAALMYYAITTNQSPAQITLLAGILLLGLSVFVALVEFGNKTILALTDNKAELKQLQASFDKQNEIFALQQKNMTENAEHLKTFVDNISDLFNKRLTEEYASICDTKEQIQQSLSAFERFLSRFNEHATALVTQFSDTQTEHHKAQLSQIKTLETGLSTPLKAIEKQFAASIEAQEKLVEVTELVINESANKFSKYQEQLVEKMTETVELLEENLDSMVSSFSKKILDSNSKHQELSLATNDLIQQQQTKLLSVIEDMSKTVKYELTANREEFSAITANDITIMEKLLKS